ncbi:DUF1329 domain-containing protein [Zavarzinia compransoris]|uniref:DUF1329 domain-containing protein n=1 Tax=Zavarzinia compransoris TaxID=1264899 RepID=A0A317DVB2_9PROT|nr:DUF1329 domain-containing protein [Zavarzinia compransoris]PWR18324.1 DUF1329 domain-containing protein [Zavarzinia compransoris]TDP43617.1 uncharacterized protein DUF1329 [Zavarzinia compransoris]
MRKALILTSALVAIFAAGAAQAGVTPEEAKRLGTTLTPVGAEMAGNAAATIPAYAGGLTTPPAGFAAGSGIRPDPFAGEKPRLVIDAGSMAGEAARLTEGAKALLTRYASFRLDVYPTHRTVTFPAFVLENTKQQATTATISADGNSISGVHAAFPFPMPKSGYEAMWNHLLRFNGLAYESKYRNFIVDASGHVTLSTEGQSTQEYPFWDVSKPDADTYWRMRLSYTGPARRAGEALMIIDPLDVGTKDRRSWAYLPGQRRVKVAPDFSFDTPNPGTAGVNTFDDVFLFNGSMDRFDFQLVGKREIYVPYNCYNALYEAKQADLLAANHLNPDLIRWELHRVWVVEAKLKEGKRHIYSRRVFYLDEDSWAALASDEYDARGDLAVAGFAYMTPSYDVPAPYSDMFSHYNLAQRTYALTGFVAETGGMRQTRPRSDREWSADALAGSGIR